MGNEMNFTRFNLNTLNKKSHFFIIENDSAHKKGSGSTKNGRDSVSKRRGLKIYGGQPVIPGSIIVRQVGNKFHAGNNVRSGNDYTLYANIAGSVEFERIRGRHCISVYPSNTSSKQPLNNSKSSYPKFSSRKTVMETDNLRKKNIRKQIP